MKNKKYMSQDEKIKQGFKIFGIVFAAMIVVAAIIGVTASTITESKRKDLLDLTDNLEEMYNLEPWDKKSDPIDYSDNIWAYYQALMFVDREAVNEGYDGYPFEAETVCVDLSKLPEEDREPVKEMMTDYFELRKVNVRFNSKSELKELGLIDEKNRETYTEGCILSFSEPKEQPEGFLELDVEFYYSQMSFTLKNVGIYTEEAWKEHVASRFEDQLVEELTDDSLLYKQELLNGQTRDTYVLTVAGKKVYCISTMTG